MHKKHGSLRPMREHDLELILEWRNDPSTRNKMFNSATISPEEHRAWFARVATSGDRHLLLYEEDGIPMAFANVKTCPHQKLAEWGFFKRPKARGGVGVAFGFTTLNYLFSEMRIHKVSGKVISGNERSYNLHLKLGFSVEGKLSDNHFDGKFFHDVFCFGLLSKDWGGNMKGEKF